MIGWFLHHATSGSIYRPQLHPFATLHYNE
jgi:hypothetical protein